jgi:hypothetical protein
LSSTSFRTRPHILALLAYLVLTVIMTWPLTPQVLTAIPGDSFDGWQNYWNLWWLKVALVDRVQNPFVTDILFAPTGVGLYFHTLNPFNGLVTLPIQLNAGLIAAYNAVVFLSWSLAGYGVFLLTLYALRRQRTQTQRQSPAGLYGPAFVAGAVFTFSPFHMAHLLGHMQVMSLQWIPFYILYLLRSLDAAQRGQAWARLALMAGLFLILTGLCDWYFVLYLLLFTGLVAVWRTASTLWQAYIQTSPHRLGAQVWRAVWRTWAPPALAGLVFVIALSPVLIPMMQEVRAFSFMVRPARELYILSASLMDFLVPNRLHPLFLPQSVDWIGNRIAPLSERTIGIGYLPLALLGVALWLDRRRAVMWAVVGLFFLFLALGPRIHLGDITWADIPLENTEEVLRRERSPFGLINQALPLLRLSRSVSRYALMVQLAASVSAGIGLAALIRMRYEVNRARMGDRTSTPIPQPSSFILIVCGALLTVLAEFWVAPYPMSPPDTPEYYARLDEELPPGAVLNLPMNWDRPGYLLYQTVHQRPLTVAYISRDDPRTATDRYPFLQHLRHLGPDILADDPAQVGRTVLADLGVGVVVLDRYKMPGGAEREVTEAVTASVFGAESPHYEDHRITVYAVTEPETRAPYLALGPLHWGPLEQVEIARGAGDPDAGGEVTQVADLSLATEDDCAAQRWRRIGPEPAAVLAYHAPPGSTLSICMDGAAGAVLQVLHPDGAIHFETQASAETDSVTLILPPAPGEGAARAVWLRALGGEVRIFELALHTE